MNEHNRIVVTGMGMVTPLGLDCVSSWENIIAGKNGIQRVNFIDSQEGKIEYLAGVVSLDSQDPLREPRLKNILTAKELCRTNRFIQLALLATDEALNQAGWLHLNDEQKARTGLSIGSACGGILSVMESADVLTSRGRDYVSAFSCPLSLSNMAAGLISIKNGFKGPMFAPATACAAGLQSFGEAISTLERDEADVMITGGSEAPLHPIVYAGFRSAGALTKCCNDNLHMASRPFDKERDGFVIAEGAAVFIIEKLSHAKKRNVQPIAEIVGYGATSDAYHITSGLKDGSGIAKAMMLAIDNSGIPTNDIGYLSAHATSTTVGDIREYNGIKRVFSDNTSISISAIKGAIGHTQGAAASIAAAFTIKALKEGLFPHTANTVNLDDGINDTDIILHEPRRKSTDFALVNGFGFGGINTALVLKNIQNDALRSRT